MSKEDVQVSFTVSLKWWVKPALILAYFVPPLSVRLEGLVKRRGFGPVEVK